MSFIGYLRAARGERLLGNKSLIESDPCTTRGAAEAWVTSMLASNVEAGKAVVESGTRKHEEAKGKTARAAKGPAARKSSRRARTRPANGETDHAPVARPNEK